MGRTFRCCKMAVKRRNPSYIRARCTWWTRVESPFLWLVVFITWAWKELVVPHPRLPSICFVLTGLTYSLPRAHVVALSDFCLQLLCCFFFFFLGQTNIRHNQTNFHNCYLSRGNKRAFSRIDRKAAVETLRGTKGALLVTQTMQLTGRPWKYMTVKMPCPCLFLNKTPLLL